MPAIPKSHDAIVIAYPFDKRKQRLSQQDIINLLTLARRLQEAMPHENVNRLVDSLSHALQESRNRRGEMATGLADAALSQFMSFEGWVK